MKKIVVYKNQVTNSRHELSHIALIN